MSARAPSLCRLIRGYLEQECACGDFARLFITRVPKAPGKSAAQQAATPATAGKAPGNAEPAPVLAAREPQPAPYGQTAPEFTPPSGTKQAKLDALRAYIGNCPRCPILVRNRKKIVFGSGNPDASIVFVGEAPGQDEDIQGLPFVGRAGQVLTNIIEKGMAISRDQVYIANILKCRPPNNREPLPDEMSHCTPFLNWQLAIIEPKVIVALGGYAAHYLTGTQTGITKLRGTWHAYRDIPVMPTFHPAYLLRNYSQENRRLVWQDVQTVIEKTGS